MRWESQSLQGGSQPELVGIRGLVDSVTSPEFSGVTFHEVVAKSALNRVHGNALPFSWTINPYRGCSHACVYCFARPTHEYLGLDGGADFDSQIVVKVNIVDVLRRELARPSWSGDPVALGTNTDPYQRAEGKYSLMPGIIEALADHHTPLSVLTKGTLIRRDAELLARAAETVPVSVALSIALVDPELHHTLEPGAPTPQARLATVKALSEAGLDVTVFLMPLIPYLTDSEAALDDSLGRIAAAGARSVAHSALHLRPGVKEWFAAWLRRTHPELVSRYRDLYGDGSYAPRGYRTELSARFARARERHGLERAQTDSATGNVKMNPPAARGARPGTREVQGTLV